MFAIFLVVYILPKIEYTIFIRGDVMTKQQQEKYRQLGLNIAYYRKQRGLSQLQLAEIVHIIKVGLTRDREELYDRINRRVDIMMQDGLLEEARSVYAYKHLNSLNTVGYKEMFKYLDGEWDLDFAIEKIKQNSRIYSRKQMTWFKRDTDIRWFHPDQKEEILQHILTNLS